MSQLQDAAARWQREGRITEEHRMRLAAILAEAPSVAPVEAEPEFALIMHLSDVSHACLEEKRSAKASRTQAAGLMAGVPRVTRLLQAQLSETNSVTEAASLAIMGKLTEVNAESGRLLGTLGTTRSRAAALQGEAGIEIEESRRLLAGMTAYQEDISGRVAETIQGLMGQLGDLTSLTTLVNTITRTATILSLNATIEAARAGSAGRAFMIIAEEMRKLSNQFEAAAKSIEEKITEVSAAVNAKLKTIAELVDAETKWFSPIGSALPRLSGSFQSVVGELDAFAMDTEEVVRTIRAAIVAALEHSQFQDISRQQLEQVHRGILLFGRQMVAAGLLFTEGSDKEAGVAAPDDVAGTLAASYTMESQRAIHTQVLGEPSSQGADGLPKIELF